MNHNTLTVNNSIIASRTNGGDCFGSITDGGTSTVVGAFQRLGVSPDGGGLRQITDTQAAVIA